jgi:hypothetical protein
MSPKPLKIGAGYARETAQSDAWAQGGLPRQGRYGFPLNVVGGLAKLKTRG